MDGEDFAFMFLQCFHGEVVLGYVEELDGAVACCDDDLVLVRFGPGEVI